MTTVQTPPEEDVVIPGQTTVEEQLEEADHDRKAARQAAQNAAYTRASARLREQHRDEFDAFLSEEYAERGMTYKRRATAEERAERERQERIQAGKAAYERLMESNPEFRQYLAENASIALGEQQPEPEVDA